MTVVQNSLAAKRGPRVTGRGETARQTANEQEIGVAALLRRRR
jgi:hypothetical protein